MEIPKVCFPKPKLCLTLILFKFQIVVNTFSVLDHNRITHNLFFYAIFVFHYGHLHFLKTEMRNKLDNSLFRLCLCNIPIIRFDFYVYNLVETYIFI